MSASLVDMSNLWKFTGWRGNGRKLLGFALYSLAPPITGGRRKQVWVYSGRGRAAWFWFSITADGSAYIFGDKEPSLDQAKAAAEKALLDRLTSHEKLELIAALERLT